MKIRASFDRIVIQFPAEDDSYVPPKKIQDYKRVDVDKVDPDPEEVYMPSYICSKYKNSLGNPMEINLESFRYKGENKSKYKIQFHSETELLSIQTVEEITEIVFQQYKDYTKAILPIRPYPAVIEIALDHFECDSYFYYYSNQNHLFKKNCRKRIEFSQPHFKITDNTIEKLKSERLEHYDLKKLKSIKNKLYIGEKEFIDSLKKIIGYDKAERYKKLILKYAYVIYNGLGFSDHYLRCILVLQ